MCKVDYQITVHYMRNTLRKDAVQKTKQASFRWPHASAIFFVGFGNRELTTLIVWRKRILDLGTLDETFLRRKCTDGYFGLRLLPDLFGLLGNLGSSSSDLNWYPRLVSSYSIGLVWQWIAQNFCSSSVTNNSDCMGQLYSVYWTHLRLQLTSLKQ